jgi:hypothetical protein
MTPPAGGGDKTPPPSTLGAYRVQFRGALSGDGNAAVSAQGVIMTARLRDENGNVGNFRAQNLSLNRGRFSGSGTYTGLPVQISGRVDPPADALRTARLVCTIQTSTARYSRALGVKR